MPTPDYTIKENSWLAKIATKKLGTQNVAMVLGKTIIYTMYLQPIF
jgi:hypothetical protein